MNNNDVVTVVTLVGEFVGKYDETGENGNGSITLTDPRMLVTNEQGMGFARGICMTGKEDPTSATFNNVAFVTPTNEDVEKAYRQHTSGIIT